VTGRASGGRACATLLGGFRLFVSAVALATLLIAHNAFASTHSGHRSHKKARSTAVALYRGALLEDAATGRVLYQENADMEWPPASMAKMMLLLVADEQVKAGRFKLDEPVRISERSASTGGSRIGVVAGQVYPLGELMKAALVKSANDAAVAVAEKIGGSVEACVRMMNQRARELGMTNTEYHTVDGLPPRPLHDVDRTTARDLATVARALIDETDLLKWSALESCPFDGGVCILHNTNHLVGHFEGCDGLKTGFTFESGFNLTATARRGNMRLIAVILGAPSNGQRFAQAARLLEWGFDKYTSVTVVKGGQPLPISVQLDSGETMQPVAAGDLSVVVPRSEVGGIKLDYRVPTAVSASLASGEPVGEVVARNGGEVVGQIKAIRPATTASQNTNAPASAAPLTDSTAPIAYRENQ